MCVLPAITLHVILYDRRDSQPHVPGHVLVRNQIKIDGRLLIPEHLRSQGIASTVAQDLLGDIVFCSSNALAQIRERSWAFISIELDCQERSRDAKPPGVGKGAVRCSALYLYLAVRFVFTGQGRG